MAGLTTDGIDLGSPAIQVIISKGVELMLLLIVCLVIQVVQAPQVSPVLCTALPIVVWA